MKTIIIAAGQGRRLAPFTDNNPKCMLKIGQQTLLEHQISAFNNAGIHDIAIITGYKKEKIDFPNLTYYVNDDYPNNNILASLFYAENALVDDVIISYSDILFSADVVKKCLQATDDIAIIADLDWQQAYEGRIHHPLSEAENIIHSGSRVIKIGKHLTATESTAEFIGMLKLSKRGATLIRTLYHELKDNYWNKPFQKAPGLQKAYLTDILQEVIDRNHPVGCVAINGGWLEIDTQEDLEKARRLYADGN